jgi:hypothetical protein
MTADHCAPVAAVDSSPAGSAAPGLALEYSEPADFPAAGSRSDGLPEADSVADDSVRCWVRSQADDHRALAAADDSSPAEWAAPDSVPASAQDDFRVAGSPADLVAAGSAADDCSAPYC